MNAGSALIGKSFEVRAPPRARISSSDSERTLGRDGPDRGAPQRVCEVGVRLLQVATATPDTTSRPSTNPTRASLNRLFGFSTMSTTTIQQSACHRLLSGARPDLPIK